MKKLLTQTEQDNLRVKGILKVNEIAFYGDHNLLFAEDVLSGSKRVINSLSMIKEATNILLG